MEQCDTVMHKLNFNIKNIDAFHLKFSNEKSYWEEYRTTEKENFSDRFEFRSGWQTVYATKVETAVLKVEMADGSVGWGETNCPIGPEVTKVIVDGIIKQMVKGKEFQDPYELWNFLYDSQRGRGYSSGYWLDTLAMLDIGVWDALGNREKTPSCFLFGVQSPRKEIPVYLSGIRKLTAIERIDEAKKWVDSGIQGFKIFLTGNIENDLAELDILQSNIPNIEEWMVDNLWMAGYEAGVKAKLEFGDRGVSFYECPLQPENIAGHRLLVKEPGSPIALGEHFRTHYQIEPWIDSPRALDIYQPDIGRTGISDFLVQRNMAYKKNIPVTPHMGNGISIFQAATLHCAAVSSPKYLQEFQGGLASILQDSATTVWKYSKGKFILPDAPGLGVMIDENKLQPYIVK